MGSRVNPGIKALETVHVPEPLLSKIKRLTKYALNARKYISELVQDADTRYFVHTFGITQDGEIEIREKFGTNGAFTTTTYINKELAEALVLDLKVVLTAYNKRLATPIRTNVNNLMRT